MRIFEQSRGEALHVDRAGVVAEVRRARARRCAAVAINAASGQIGAAQPAHGLLQPHRAHRAGARRDRAAGLAGGEAITDGRALLHYFRTTHDGRILLGWGGGRMEAARTHGRAELDPEVVEQPAARCCGSSRCSGRRIAHAWGGPIDVSPTHLPAIVALRGGRAWAAFGYTGNGVGPSHLAGRSLAALALGRSEDAALGVDRPAAEIGVPPEPLRVAGASVIRAAIARKEAAEAEG